MQYTLPCILSASLCGLCELCVVSESCQTHCTPTSDAPRASRSRENRYTMRGRCFLFRSWDFSRLDRSTYRQMGCNNNEYVSWSTGRGEGGGCCKDGSPARLRTISALHGGETGKLRPKKSGGWNKMFKVGLCRPQVRPHKALSRNSCRKWEGTERRMQFVRDISVILQTFIICTSSGKAPRRNYYASGNLS